MSEIRRINRQPIRLKKLFKEKTGFGAPEVDPRLSYQRSPNEEYTFENGRIHINGMDIRSLMESDEVEIELLANLMGAIDEYRKEVWSKYGTRRPDFNGETQALLEKGMNKLGSTYEEMSGGVKIRLNGGRLWINDIDPKVVLALFLSNPTEERRRYLKSIHMKLALILEGKIGNAHSNGILEETRAIFIQIAKAFENAAAGTLYPLLATAGAMDR